MKKSLYFLMALAAIAMSCSKVVEPMAPADEPAAPEVTAVEGVPFSFNAGFLTKTVNEGMSTKWAAGDQISLFNAAAGAAYAVNGAFSIAEADLEDGIFYGELAAALTADAYDWAAIYPYNEANTSIEAAAVTFGAAAVTAAVDSKALLAGANVPLFGKTAGVAKDAALSIQLEQLAAVAKIIVKNPTAEAYTLNKVTVTFPEAVVGAFTANLAGEAPAYTAAEGAAATVVVTLAEPASIAAGANAVVYVPLKPFVAAAGSKISYKINDEDAMEINASTFKAGVIKPVYINVPVILPERNLVANIAVKGAGEEVTLAEGYTVTSATPSADWITVADGKATFAANATAAPRYAVINVKATGSADKLVAKYWVAQAANNAFMIFDSFKEDELSDMWVGNRNLSKLTGDYLEMERAAFNGNDDKGQPLYYNQFIHMVNENTYNKVLVSFDFETNNAQCAIISYNVEGFTTGQYVYSEESQWYSAWVNDCAEGQKGGSWWNIASTGWCAMGDAINAGSGNYTKWMRFKVDNGYTVGPDHGGYSVWTLVEDENGIFTEGECVFSVDKNWWADGRRIDTTNPGKGGYMGLWVRNHPFYPYGHFRNFTICYENN